MKLSGDMESERLQDIYERLDELDAASAETKAARILHGLGEPPPPPLSPSLSLPHSLSLPLPLTLPLTHISSSLHAYPSPQFLVVDLVFFGGKLTLLTSEFWWGLSLTRDLTRLQGAYTHILPANVTRDRQ